jgi:hypothetical protein
MPIFTQPGEFSPAAAQHAWVGYRAPLLSGEQGTAQTIEIMRHLVDQAVGDESFVRQAINIVRPVPAYHDLSEAKALYNWVKQNIRFTKDPVTKEKLYPPQELLKIKAGDCDDISMLLGALLIALGYTARLITISASADNPQEFSHVYVEAEVPPGSKQWIPMDAARFDSEFGEEPPVYYRKRAWSLVDSSYQDLAGSRAFVHANTISGWRSKLPRQFSGLGSYGFVDRARFPGLRGMGDDGDVNYEPILAQSIAEIPTIISAETGQKSSVTTPYGSFATGYTPGATIPPAGYVAPVAGVVASVGSSSSMLLWLGLGAAMLFMVMGKRQ